MATQIQGTVSSALGTLGFESPPTDGPPVMGGPIVLKLSDGAADALKGKTVKVNGDGTVTID